MQTANEETIRLLSLTLTIPQAAQLLGLSVSKAYEAARSGELPTVRVGTRVLISRRRLEERGGRFVSAAAPQIQSVPGNAETG